jgi:hypothetical protein
MQPRRILFALLAIVMFSLPAPGGLFGAQYYGWIRHEYYGPVPYYICNPKEVENNETGPNTRGGAVWSNRSLSGGACPSAYPYGYFGTQSRPYSVSHQNYYNDFIQWSFRRGY